MVILNKPVVFGTGLMVDFLCSDRDMFGSTGAR